MIGSIIINNNRSNNQLILIVIYALSENGICLVQLEKFNNLRIFKSTPILARPEMARKRRRKVSFSIVKNLISKRVIIVHILKKYKISISTRGKLRPASLFYIFNTTQR